MRVRIGLVLVVADAEAAKKGGRINLKVANKRKFSETSANIYNETLGLVYPSFININCQ